MWRPKLVYLSEARVPSRSSNSMQTMRMCAAFAAAGADVTLRHIADDGERPEGFGGDVNEFYGVPDTFARRPHALVTPRRLARVGRAERPLRSAVLMGHLLQLAAARGDRTIVYTRSHLAALLAAQVRRLSGPRGGISGLAIEIHDQPPGDAAWRTLGAADVVIVISKALEDLLLQRMPGLRGRILVEHDGVDLDAVRPEALRREVARARLGLPATTPLVAYTGRVNTGKGVGVLAAAAPEIHRTSGAEVLLVGKVYEDRYLSAPHVTTTGFVPPAHVPAYLAAADVLVMPTTEDLPYAAYTSPLKLFEYMAAERPVVASGLATVREVLRDSENALLYPPADPAALAAAVQRLLSNRELSQRLAAQAAADVREYSWVRRAERILARL